MDLKPADLNVVATYISLFINIYHVCCFLDLSYATLVKTACSFLIYNILLVIVHSPVGSHR